MRPGLLIFLLVIVLTGCGSSPSHVSHQNSGVLPGKVYEEVTCSEYPAHSYAIYLPSTYIPGDSLPLFLAFDPAGSGATPVNHYKDVAEKYHFILIGSNNSQNGQGADETQQVLAILLSDLGERYSINPDRIYCTGFSGGSRVSAMIAFYGGGIKGVIGCGAGLPATSTPLRFPTDYYGIVGDQDFNYLEMVGLATALGNQKLRSTLHIFHGPHAWPPAEDFEAAVGWHWSNAMNEGMISPDQTILLASQKDIQENNSMLKAVDLNALETERDLQQHYAESMQTENLAWWQNAARKLKHPSNPADTLLNKRLMSYMSIMAYTYSIQALAGKSKGELSRMIGIYEIVDPENRYISYLKEQLNTLP
jgi:predicted esterase